MKALAKHEKPSELVQTVPTEGDRPRVYFPVESLSGLGHFNRAGLLAKAMHAAGMEVTIASGTFVDEERFFPHARRVALPAYVHRNSDGKHTVWNEDGQKKQVEHFDQKQWEKDRVAAHREIVAKVRPDIIVFEFWPFSRRNLTHEVNAIRGEAMKHGIKPMWISSVRDVIKGDVRNLKGNKAGHQETRDNSALDKLNKIDAIIIHGDERLIKLSNTFSHLRHIAHKTYYSGYVVTDIPKRDEVIPADARPVLFHVGSGSNGADFLLSAAKAWKHATPELKEKTWHFVTGPRFPDGGWANLTKILKAQGDTFVSDGDKPYVPPQDGERPRFVVERYRNDLVTLIANSAVSASYAGYNTTQEVLASKVKALLVPKLKKREVEGDVWFDAEQSHRLDELKKLGLARTLSAQDAVNPEKLATAVKNAYAAPVKMKKPIDFNGAQRTAELIGHLYSLHHRKPSEAAHIQNTSQVRHAKKGAPRPSARGKTAPRTTAEAHMKKRAPASKKKTSSQTVSVQEAKRPSNGRRRTIIVKIEL